MSSKPTSKMGIQAPGSAAAETSENGGASVRTPLYQILWQRKSIVAGTFGGVVALAIAYLLLATSIYTATAHLYIEQNIPKVAAEAQGFTLKDDNFLPTQVEIVRSAPILQAALEQCDWKNMHTFKNVGGDPLDWLWHNSAFQVEVGKKDDILSISMDTAWPSEGATFVNSVVAGFVNYQSTLKRGTGSDMVRILVAQKKEVEAELDGRTQAMLKFKAENGALSFNDQDKGNIVLERLAALSSSLTAAELARVDLETQFQQANTILANPDSITHFVQSQQMKEKDWGDHSYDELRSQLTQAQVNLSAISETLEASNPRAKSVESLVKELQRKLTQKERAIAEANADDIGQQLAAAKQKEQSIKSALDGQQKLAMDLNVKAAEFDRLTADVDRVQKQNDLLDTRIKEVRLNSQDAGSLAVTVLAPARIETRPSKPKKSFVLAAAGLLGILLGSGLALLQDYRDNRIRSVDDCATVLGVPIVGMIPHMKMGLSVPDRGQVVHRDPMSEASEAYRTVRTAIHFGASDVIHTVMVTSPTPGDGKSTIASNLAIAMAQAGHRTLLIDADLRRPTQHHVFEAEPTSGLSSVLSGIATLQEAAIATAIDGLTLLPCGPIPRNPSEMLSSVRFTEFLQSASQSFDRLVIDSPPVLPVADAKVIGAVVDAVLLVVRIDKSDRKASAIALQGLQSVGANVFGWVANDMSANSQAGYGGYYGNYYGNGDRNNSASQVVAEKPTPAIAPNRAA